MWHCGAVVKELQRSRIRNPATLFAVSFPFFFLLFQSSFFNPLTSLACFPLFLVLTLLLMHLDQYIFEAYTVSPEFYFEKGISRALDLHTGLTVRKKKNILSCQDMSLL